MTTAEVKKIIFEMTKANNAFTKQTTGAADLFIKEAVKAQSKLLNKISELIAGAPDMANISIDSRVAWYAGQADKITEMMKASGYSNVVDKYLSSYDNFAKFAEKSFRAAGWDSAFAKVSPEYIKFMQRNDFNYFSFLQNEATTKINSTIFEMSVGGYTRTAMLKELKGVITGEYEWGSRQGLYEWHAGTYVRTQASRTQQAFMNYQAEQVNAEDYLYLGPFDSKTRVFCRQIVGEVFTKEEIMMMDNGQSGDVYTDGGGWNCRHQWLATLKEVANKLKENKKEMQDFQKKINTPMSKKEIAAFEAELEKAFAKDDWIKTLTDEETASLRSWKGGGYERIREYQRLGERKFRTYISSVKGKRRFGFKGASQNQLQFLATKIKNEVKNIEAAINKDGKYTNTIYRGLYSLSSKEYNKIINSEELIWKAFASASSDRQVALNFTGGSKSILFKVTPKSAVDIKNVAGGYRKEESEVLMRVKSKYKVTKVITGLNKDVGELNAYTEVILEEI